MFAYRLAKDLGIVDVDGMMESLTARQLQEWMAFYQIERKHSESNGDTPHEQTADEMLRELGG